MKIDYSLTLKEYYRYQGLLMRRTPWIIYSFLVALAFFLLTPWINDYVRYSTGMPPDIAHDLLFNAVQIVGFCGGVTLFLALPWLLNRQYLLEIDKEGIAFKLGRAIGHSPWSAINRIDQDKDYIYVDSKGLSLGKLLTTSYNDPAMKTLPLAMLPKRVFGFPAEAQAFFDQATAYWKEAVGQPAETSDAWPPAPTG